MCLKNMAASHSALGLKIVPQIMEEMKQKSRNLSRSCSDLKSEDSVPSGSAHPVADTPITHAQAHAHAPSRPLRRLRPTTSLPPEREAGREILDILLCKANSGSLDLHHTGSPPCRAGNPMIYDAQFCQRKVLPSSGTISHNSAVLYRANSYAESSSTSVSAGPKASVRIEGFMTSKGESNQGIPAFA